MNRRAWFAVVVTAGVVLLLSLGLTACLRTPPAGAPTLPVSRYIQPATTPNAGLAFVAWSAPTYAVPPLRPTYDPLYSPGARYPLGAETIQYLDNIWAEIASPDNS